MKTCLACGCHIVANHKSDLDCLKALSIEKRSLQKRLREIEATQHKMQPTLLNVPRKMVTCPRCSLVFGVDLSESQSG